ncbi:response regulator [Hymenobacter psychrotolerans]|uniref:Two component transcriptional regulator, LuxR family n=1 Tax=Hymenobacter psychrotolerans DSM 18569 TaxID=1121959 RepID=A0A1M7BX41_9BACT|nr:response regulator transcription factor [Hymenobacter psychrotolerans]SHL59551.1 two component transcriptional regulator, LuxR family [Hymenobacter psychrotolerans DSM 18569]
MIRVLLTDDHPIIRDGIRSLVQTEPSLTIVGEAGDGQALLNLLPTTPADVVVLDLNMPGLSGFDTIPLLRQQYPDLNILVLSMLDNEQYVAQTLRSGALGYALKNTTRAELIYAITTVARGQPYLSTTIALELLRKLHQPSDALADPLRPALTLSKRELEVLRLIAEGLTSAEIADRLFTSKRTIETHRQNIIEKTQAKNTAALIRFAVSNGLV